VHDEFDFSSHHEDPSQRELSQDTPAVSVQVHAHPLAIEQSLSQPT